MRHYSKGGESEDEEETHVGGASEADDERGDAIADSRFQNA